MPAALRLTNTLTKKVEPFEPLSADGPVRLYSCGPTVYSFAHIGNFRTFLVADLLRRVLERNGYQVRQVMNITDVGHMTEDHLADAEGEDKLSKAARTLGWDPYRVAEHFMGAFVADARALRLRNYSAGEADDVALHPRATNFIPEMLALIQRLIERNHAYVDSQGQVYFSIESFPEYGQLSGKVLDELEAGARVEVREEKRDPRDFALWKVDGKHLMQWDPQAAVSSAAHGWSAADRARLSQLLPTGLDPRVKRGFPGWHIECSAMSNACLGETIDIHTGGEDNVFPHHECEIAQSCAALGTVVPGPSTDPAPRRSFARYWLHGRHLLVDGRKMSKRDGSFYTVRDLLDPIAAGRPELRDRLIAAGFPEGAISAQVLRLALMWGHYRHQMNFSLDSLTQAKNAVQRLQSLYDRALELAEAAPKPAAKGAVAIPAPDTATEIIAAGLGAFDEALRDDLDMERGMAVVLDLVGRLNVLELGRDGGRAVCTAIENIDQVLDVLVRRRMGLLDKERIARWSDPAFCAERAAALSAWQTDPTRKELLAQLGAGQVPAVPALIAVSDAISGDLDDDLIELMIAARQLAKKNRDFAAADGARNHLKARGVIIEDLPAGVRWKAV
jgi:cysteinyl-tRNA synthetase